MTSRVTYRNMSNWVRDVRRVYENIPFVIVSILNFKIDHQLMSVFYFYFIFSDILIFKYIYINMLLESQQVSNKMDDTDNIAVRHIDLHTRLQLSLCGMSVKSSDDLRGPFLILARKLLKYCTQSLNPQTLLFSFFLSFLLSTLSFTF